MKIISALAMIGALIACNGQDPRETQQSGEQDNVSGEVVADKLEEAAENSEAEAAEVLEDAADRAEEMDTLPPVDEPGSFAQEAMKNAGEAVAE